MISNIPNSAPVYPMRTVARMTNLDVGRIRAWEDSGLLTPARTDKGQRLYSQNDIDYLKWIKSMREQGLSLQRIRRLIESKKDTDSPSSPHD